MVGSRSCTFLDDLLPVPCSRTDYGVVRGAASAHKGSVCRVTGKWGRSEVAMSVGQSLIVPAMLKGVGTPDKATRVR
jgi:hypothetical protein